MSMMCRLGGVVEDVSLSRFVDDMASPSSRLDQNPDGTSLRLYQSAMASKVQNQST